MYFVKRGERYVDVAGQSFRDLMAGRLAGLPGERATISDWANHISTIFPEVRLKRYLEMRGADSGPWRWLPALPAYWVGILYDDNALDAAWDLVKDWTAAERQKLRDDVPRLGFAATIAGRERAAAGEDHARARASRDLRDAGGLTPAATTRADTCDRSRNASRAVLRRPRSCWRNSTDPGSGSVEPVFREYAY